MKVLEYLWDISDGMSSKNAGDPVMLYVPYTSSPLVEQGTSVQLYCTDGRNRRSSTGSTVTMRETNLIKLCVGGVWYVFPSERVFILYTIAL